MYLLHGLYIKKFSGIRLLLDIHSAGQVKHVSEEVDSNQSF